MIWKGPLTRCVRAAVTPALSMDRPLSRPSATLSPPCGERAGRGVPIWSMVPMHAKKRKGALQEPAPSPLSSPPMGERIPRNENSRVETHEPRKNIEHPTSNTERRSERGVALPFDVRRWMFDVGCSSGFMGRGQGEGRCCFQLARLDCNEALGDTTPAPGRHDVPIGDHELGKMSLFGGKGGFRLASWRRATTELALQPFWRTEIGNYVLIGLTSSLLAFPVYEPEALLEERKDWAALREAHLVEVRQ